MLNGHCLGTQDTDAKVIRDRRVGYPGGSTSVQYKYSVLTVGAFNPLRDCKTSHNLWQPSFQALHQDPQQSPHPDRMSGSRSGAVARLDTIYSAIKAANEKYEHENSDNTAALVYTELPSLGLARWGIQILLCYYGLFQ